MRKEIIAMDMTGIYKRFKENYIQDSLVRSLDVRDFSNLSGTDAYCDETAYETMSRAIKDEEIWGIHLLDNGNYHYLSRLFTSKIREPYKLLVFDNHPDSQAPAFGDILSCGGWIRDLVLKDQYIEQVLLVGLRADLLADLNASFKESFKESFKDGLDSLKNQDEAARISYEKARLEKITFISSSQLADLDLKALIEDFIADSKYYLSIDRDVLAGSEINTNWDQGLMKLSDLVSILKGLDKNKIIGADICAESLSMCDDARSIDVHKAIIEALTNTSF